MITKDEKIIQYEQFLHLLQLYAEVVMDHKKTSKLIENACRWSYAHRCGNGEFSDREQKKIIERAFRKLLEVE